MSIEVHEKKISKNFVAPDGGWGWVIVLSSLMIHVIMDGITYALGQYLKIFVDDFNSSHAIVSVIHGLLPAITLGCGPIGSILTNTIGCRLTTIIGAIIASIGFILSCFVDSIYLLYVTIGIICGIGFGLVYVPAIVCVGYYFEKRRSLAMGIAVCGSGIGTFLFAPINRFLIGKYDWEGAFLIKAAIILNICICGMLMVPVPIEPSEILKRKKLLEKKMKANNSAEETRFLEEDQEKLKNDTNQLASLNNRPINKDNALFKSYSSLNYIDSMPNIKTNSNQEADQTKSESNQAFDIKILLNMLFLLFAISNFLTSLGFNAPYIYINDQAISHGISQEHADILLQIIGISNMIGRIVLGFLSDLKQFNRLYLYSSVITICGLANLIEPFLKTFPLLAIYAGTFGFTSGGYVSLTALLLVDLLGLENLSNAFGILLVFQGVATAVGPPIAGAMFDATESYVISFLFVGSMIALSGVMCFFFPCLRSYKDLQKSKKKKENEAICIAKV